jgi:NDP-sugar pyrophosphorylase family protein
MLVPVEPIAGLDGDYIFHENQVITRLDRHEPAPTYCSGIQVVNPRLIRSMTEEVEDFESLWHQLMPQGQLRAGRVYPKRWFSVDTLEQLKELALLPD